MPSAPSSLISTHRSAVHRTERKDDRKKLEFDWPTKEKEKEFKAKRRDKGKEKRDARDEEQNEMELGDKGHINFWDGIEKEVSPNYTHHFHIFRTVQTDKRLPKLQSALTSTSTTKPKPKPTPDEIQDDDPTTMYLHRPERETKPWYTDPELRRYEDRQEGEDAQAKKERRR